MPSKLPRILISSFFLFLTLLLIISTPIAQAATSNHIVISEVQVSEATTGDEFVELYNPTANDVNLANWKLTRKTTAGAESDLVSTVSGIIKSHGYFFLHRKLDIQVQHQPTKNTQIKQI